MKQLHQPFGSLAGLCSPLALTLTATAVLGGHAIAQTSDQDHLRDNIIGQLRWRELGPVQSGGRIVDIAVHPDRSQEFWLASGSGGIWHTTNGGISFEAQFQDQHSISIGDICVAPSAPNVLYVGTGEANNQRSSYWGNGVYRSDDSGATWKHLGLDGTEHIGRIVVHPEDPDTAYVAALGALYSGNEERGLYKTSDGGSSWQRVHHISSDVGFVDVALHPQKPDVVFAASYERRRRAWDFSEGGQGSALWRSSDAGKSWDKLDNGLPDGLLGRIGIEPFAADGDVLYACIENLNPRGTKPTPASDPTDERDGDGAGAAGGDADAGQGESIPAEVLADPVALHEWQTGDEEAQDPKRSRRPRRRLVGGEVYRSDDGGDSWQKTHSNDTSIGGSPGYYYGQVRVDPNDRDTLYVLSVQVYRSRDGGKTWTPGRRRGRGRSGAGKAFATGLHVDHHALWIDPRDSEHCLLGNDGGIAKTFDRGDSWDHLTHLPIVQFYALGVDNRTPYRVYGGTQDNGTWGFPIHGETSAGIEATDAYKVSGGDGFYAVVDPSDPDVVYSESQFGGLLRSNLATGERKSIKPRAEKGRQSLRFNWSTPVLVSPHAPHTIYTGSQHLHRSRDRGDTWATISDDLSSNDADKQRGDVPHCTITSIAESPLRPGHLWVGTDDGRVWRTRDGGQSWSERSASFPDATQELWVSRIEASAHDADTVFVAFTGYREDHRAPYLFRSDDGGDSFLSISHDLPNEPVNVVREHPRNGRVLLCGTEMGCYVSIDDGAHWNPLGQNLPRVAVHDLVVHPTHAHVLVATHGRGIWAMDAAALETLEPNVLRQSLVALPPSDGVLLRRAVDRGYVGARSWSASNPFTTPTFRYLLSQDSEEEVRIEVLDVTGNVVWSAEGPSEAGYHEVPWQAQRRGRTNLLGAARGGRGGRGNRGPRAGTFAVRIQQGERSSTQAFAVHDRRGTSSMLGAWPGEDALAEEEGEEEECGQRDEIR
ncbi:MAG: WD40/YVTN/BNR-like repeat-containing protein [Planctomycetota bacterium]